MPMKRMGAKEEKSYCKEEVEKLVKGWERRKERTLVWKVKSVRPMKTPRVMNSA